MPIQVQGPDGQTFEFPDGTDQGVMRSAMQKHYGVPKKSNGIDPMFADAKAGFNYGTNMSPQEARGRNITGFTPLMSSSDRADVRAAQRYQERVDRAKLHSSLGSAGDAVSGAYHGITGAVDSVGDLVSDGYNALTGSSGKTLSSLVSGNSLTPSQLREQDYRQQMQGNTAAKVGDLTANLAMLAAPAAKVGQLTKGAGYLAKITAQGGFGAAQGALQPVVDGESRLDNAKTGAEFGAGGQALGSTIGAWGAKAADAVSPLTRELAETARKYGIPLHVSQVTDSLPAKLAASASKYLPFSGAGAAAAKQQGAWNDALSQVMGNKAGIARPLSDEAMQATRSRIGGIYNDVYGRNAITLDNGAVRNMAGIANDASTNLTQDGSSVVGKQIDKILTNFQDGTVSGSRYQALRGELDKAAKSNPGAVGDAIKQLRRELDQAAARSLGPQDAEAIRGANSQWANMRTVEDALKQAGGAKENVAPGNLWNLVRKGSTQEMRDLARLGKGVLQDQIPDSGTAGRNLFYGALGGAGPVAYMGHPGAFALPAAQMVGGATIGRALNSPTLARIMLRDSPGAWRGFVGQQLLPYGSLAAVPAQAQFRNNPNNSP